MKKILSKLIQAAFDMLSVKKRFYSFFYFMYLQGLRGIDHGYSYIYPENSGEYDLLKKIAIFYEGHTINFFDVGANTGYYSKNVLKIFKNNINIYCFEPSSFTYRKLVENLGASVKAFQVALSNRTGGATLHTDKDGSGTASIEEAPYAPPFGIVSSVDEHISTETLDHFYKRESITKIHFLKMDVEGHEYAVLDGAKEVLNQKSIDFIQFEFGRMNIDSCTPLKKFYNLLHRDYDIYRIVRSGLIPQIEYNYEYEVYLGTNFLAINKLLNNDALKRLLNKPFSK